MNPQDLYERDFGMSSSPENLTFTDEEPDAMETQFAGSTSSDDSADMAPSSPGLTPDAPVNWNGGNTIPSGFAPSEEQVMRL